MNPITQHIIFVLLLIQFSLFGTTLIGQSYEARLEMDWEDGSTVIEGLFLNHTSRSLDLNFQLIIERKSKTGNVVNNRQSGSFQVKANREKLVTLTNINIDELDFYRIYFKIYKKGKVIAEDYIVKWEELGLELSDRSRLSNEETKTTTSIDIGQEKNRPTISFYKQKEVKEEETSTKPVPKPVPTQEKPQISEELKTTEKKDALAAQKAEKLEKQNKKQTYTTPIVQTERKTNQHSTEITVEEKTKIVDTAEQKERQQATKDFLTELIEQQKAKTKQTPIPTSEQTTKPPVSSPVVDESTKKEVATKDVEFGGLIFDDSRTKTGRDFYDIFYSNYIPPKGAENFNITIKELPGRGRMAQVAVLVNDNQVLLRLLQPRATLIEEQAIQSVYAIEAYLRNAAQLKKQLESDDQQGSGIF